jgi:hypothetical protein
MVAKGNVLVVIRHAGARNCSSKSQGLCKYAKTLLLIDVLEACPIGNRGFVLVYVLNHNLIGARLEHEPIKHIKTRRLSSLRASFAKFSSSDRLQPWRSQI